MDFRYQIVGLFGAPVAENPTGVMVEAAFRDLGLRWRYLPMDIAPADLPAAVAGARAMGFRGFHCTIPHKVAVADLLDGLGQSAALMRTVNCVVRQGDRLVGENTDGKGLLMALGEPVAGRSVSVLGAGGAARAICFELALAGVSRLSISNRSADRAAALLDLLASRLPAPIRAGLEVELLPWDGRHAVRPGSEIVVNATSMGLFPAVDERPEPDLSTLRAGAIVCDVVPNPPDTAFLRAARDSGCRVVDGLEMLVMQGALSVELWCREGPSLPVMRAALAEAFRGAAPGASAPAAAPSPG